jgi:dihydroxy-acid dehydratase
VRAISEPRAGTITPADWVDLESHVTRRLSTCNTIGTASTMTSIADAMGLILPGASRIPAVDSAHPLMASGCGARAVEMVREDLRLLQLLDQRSIENGAAACMALGGQAHEGCDFDFLAGAGRVPEPPIF